MKNGMRVTSLILLMLTLTGLTSLAHAAPKIIVDGVKGKAKQNVHAYLTRSRERCDAPAWRVRTWFDKADSEIAKALQAVGYYKPKIEKKLRIGKKCWRARFTVDPGPRVKLRKIQITLKGEAKNDPAFQEILNNHPLQPGDGLRQDRYEGLKDDIEDLGEERGYLDGRFVKHKLLVHPEAGYADIVLTYDSGGRYRFGVTRIEQDVLDPDLVSDFIDYDEGNSYSRSKIKSTYRGLVGSHYFGQVDVRPRLDERQDGQIPISIELDRGKTTTYSVGAGFVTDSGPRLSLRYQNERFNRYGHQLDSKLSLSPVISEITSSYRLPLTDPRRDWLSLETGFQVKDTDTSESNTFKAGINRAIQRDDGWYEKQFLTFEREDFTVAGEDGTSNLLTPGINWSKTVADDRLYPRKGYYLGIETLGSLRPLLSDVSFMQIAASGKWITRLPFDARLVTRADVGFTVVDRFDDLPTTQRFFAGGDKSIRGYDFESLGPEDSAGRVTGGRNLFVGSVEVTYPVLDKWSLAAFVDFGNAFNGTDIDIKTGVGPGLRWRSPVGTIRLDIGFPLDGDDDAFRVHFRIGPEL